MNYDLNLFLKTISVKIINETLTSFDSIDVFIFAYIYGLLI